MHGAVAPSPPPCRSPLALVIFPHVDPSQEGSRKDCPTTLMSRPRKESALLTIRLRACWLWAYWAMVCPAALSGACPPSAWLRACALRPPRLFPSHVRRRTSGSTYTKRRVRRLFHAAGPSREGRRCFPVHWCTRHCPLLLPALGDLYYLRVCYPCLACSRGTLRAPPSSSSRLAYTAGVEMRLFPSARSSLGPSLGGAALRRQG